MENHQLSVNTLCFALNELYSAMDIFGFFNLYDNLVKAL
jgi:hypothetical protein